MRKLFLWTFVLTLLCCWSFAIADTGPTGNLTSSQAPEVQAAPKSDVDLEAARQQKEALRQEMLSEQEQIIAEGIQGRQSMGDMPTAQNTPVVDLAALELKEAAALEMLAQRELHETLVGDASHIATLGPRTPGEDLILVEVCPLGWTIFGQDPEPTDGAWAFNTSDIDAPDPRPDGFYKVYDNFWGVDEPICDLHFWGLDMYFDAGWFDCDEPDPPWDIEIIFYPDDGSGAPNVGSPSFTYTPVITRTLTGEFYAGLYEMNRYDCILDPCFDLLTDGWLSIQGTDLDGSPQNCWFMWANNRNGDGSAYQQQTTDPNVLTQLGMDQAFCLTRAEYQPVTGACCDDETGVCNDDVDVSDCPPPLRFAEGTLCADLDPQCGDTGPPNDDCADAIEIGEVVDLPFDNIDATTDGPDEPVDCSWFGYTHIDSDVWYRYTASCDADVTVSLCGSAYDTKIAVYTDQECPPQPGPITCNDDDCGLQSQVTFAASAGTAYLVRIGGYEGAQGAGILNISCDIPDPCENAIWHNGNPLGGASASQCAYDYPFAAAVADDFILEGAEPITINQVVAWIWGWNAAFPTPADYDGVNVTIYNHDPVNNWPGGNPIDGDPDCGHTGDIVATQYVPAGSFSYTDAGHPMYRLDIPVCIEVEPNTILWLEVQPVVAFGVGGQTGMVPSDIQQGFFGHQVFELLGTPPWEAQDTDYAFCLLAGECEVVCPEDEITVDIFTDSYGSETTWEIVDQATQEVVCSGGPYTGQNNEQISETCCVSADGCYDFTIYDLYGDGICCLYGDGHYEVYLNGVLQGEGGEFEYEESILGIGNGCAPCIVDCPEPSTPEGEPDCGPEYVDVTNGGCNSEPPVFGSISCGETICGTAGVFPSGENTYRDTDWYTLILDNPTRVTITAMAEFEIQVLMLTPADPPEPCPSSSSGLPSGTAEECVELVLVGDVDAGTYYIWAGTADWNTEWECGSVYYLTVECSEPPLGACCNADLECIGDLNVFECSAQGGGWFEGETCADFECVLFEQVCAAETGNMKECDVSNYGALGDFDNGGLSYDWNETGDANYGGTFMLGNSATTMLLKYGTGVDNNPFIPAGFLNCLDTYHPSAAYDDGGVYNGLRVDYAGCGFLPPEEEDIFIHEFVITNTSGTDINGLYAAVFFDWDIGAGAADTVEFDAANNLLIQYPRPPGEGTYYGISLLTESFNTLMIVSQPNYSWPQSGWHGESLYTYMSMGGTQYPFDPPEQDMGSLVSLGPFDLTAAGATQSKTVAFAIIGGASAADVSDRAALAPTLYPCLEGDCVYVPGDSDENDTARELTDVVKMIAYYRGFDTPGYVCYCTEDLPEYKPSADVDGNCVSFELTDVVKSIAAYRGPEPLAGCPDCPGSRLGAPGEGTLIVPSLKSKAKINQRFGD